jgi:hypothetical protein
MIVVNLIDADNSPSCLGFIVHPVPSGSQIAETHYLSRF